MPGCSIFALTGLILSLTVVFKSPRDVARFANINFITGWALASDDIDPSISATMVSMLDSTANGVFVGVYDIDTPLHI